GLIATSGCPSGEIQVRLRLGQWEEAVRAAADMQDIFGKENYYIELMDHGLDIERRVTQQLLELARHIDAPLLATNDLHYTTREDAHAHEALLCVQSGSTLEEPTYDQGGKRFAFSGSGYYLKSAEEMRELFAELPEACDNTLRVAEQCEVSYTEEVGRYMPHFPVPEGEDEVSTFVQLVPTGRQRRYTPGGAEEARRQVEYEVDVLTGKGYAGYCLVVADSINWAKDHGIRVGLGRGSGAGSMAAYAMSITELDPLEHGLIFERF